MEKYLSDIFKLFTKKNKKYMPETLKTIIGVIPVTINKNNQEIAELKKEISSLELETIDEGTSEYSENYYSYFELIKQKNAIIIKNIQVKIKELETRNKNLMKLLDNATKLQEQIKEEYQGMVEQNLPPEMRNMVNNYLSINSQSRRQRSRSNSNTGGKTRRLKRNYKK